MKTPPFLPPFSDSASFQTPLPDQHRGNWAGRVQSVCHSFSSPVLPSHAFPLLWQDSSMGCSAPEKRAPEWAHHGVFRSVHSLQHGSSGGCSALPWSISISSFSLSDLGVPFCFLLFLFPPPPSTQHFLPFLSYALAEAPPALPLGSATARSAPAVEPPGAWRTWNPSPLLSPQSPARRSLSPSRHQHLARRSRDQPEQQGVAQVRGMRRTLRNAMD